jgi:hypothetical protein
MKFTREEVREYRVARGFLLKFDSIVVVGKRQKNVPFILINKRDWLLDS